MVENTVVLNIEKYDELKSFEKAVNESNFICWNAYRGINIFGIKESEVVDLLKEKIETLHRQIHDLKNPKVEEMTVNKIKQMGLFSLIKWKLKNKS